MKDTTVIELKRIFASQKAAFAGDRNPDLETRLRRLRMLDAMLIEYREPIRRALAQDFATHHPLVTDLFESGAVISRSRYLPRTARLSPPPDDVRKEPAVPWSRDDGSDGTRAA